MINIKGEGKRTTMIREEMVDVRSEKRLQRKGERVGMQEKRK